MGTACGGDPPPVGDSMGNSGPDCNYGLQFFRGVRFRGALAPALAPAASQLGGHPVSAGDPLRPADTPSNLPGWHPVWGPQYHPRPAGPL